MRQFSPSTRGLRILNARLLKIRLADVYDSRQLCLTVISLSPSDDTLQSTLPLQVEEMEGTGLLRHCDIIKKTVIDLA